MYMERVMSKLKPVFLLIGMTLVSLLIIFVTDIFRKSPEVYTPTNNEILQTQDQGIITTDTDTSTPSKVTVEDNFGVVLSASSGGNIDSCKNIVTKIDSQSVCERDNSGEVDFYDSSKVIPWPGDMVSKNATVYLTYVPVPLELFSGMDVKDSNRLISSENPTFKAAGEQIDETTVNVLLPPGTQIDEYKPWIEEEPFSMKYELGFLQGAFQKSDEGEIGIEEKLTNDCEYCNNKSNPNPEKSNTFSELMLDKTYLYPGQKDKMIENAEIEKCGKEDRFEAWGTTDFQSCIASLPDIAISFISSISLKDWLDCFIDREKCMDPKEIMIIMSSPFGSEEVCKDGICTNAYMNTRNSSSLPPSSSKGKFYYTTECKAIIQGRPYTVNCAWDMSHLYKEKDFSGFDDLPKVESIPSDTEYNEFLKNEVKGDRKVAIPL